MINKTEFDNQKFIKKGIIEFNKDKSLYRAQQGWIPSNNIDLRDELYNTAADKHEEFKKTSNTKTNFYDFIYMSCRIPEDTFKKAINGKYKYTRSFLSKYSVGLKLDIDQANKLFRCHSGELNLTNDFDYIIYHALKTKDDIDYFIQETFEYTGIKLEREK